MFLALKYCFFEVAITHEFYQPECKLVDCSDSIFVKHIVDIIDILFQLVNNYLVLLNVNSSKCLSQCAAFVLSSVSSNC